jgi:penicillin amidase
MEMAKRTVLGTVAEALGPSYVNYDKGVRSNYSPASIQQQYEALGHREKEIFEGYAAGVNARIAEVLTNQATLLPKQFTDYGFLPVPWTAFDVVMVFVGTMCNRFSDFPVGLSNLDLLNSLNTIHNEQDAWDIFKQLQWVNDPSAPTTVPSEDKNAFEKTGSLKQSAKYDVTLRRSHWNLISGEEEKIRQEKELLARFKLDSLVEPPSASNVWLLGDKKTYGRGSIIVNGPQFGWYIPGYVYEIGLHGAGFDVVGNAPFGYPAILFGHNKHIAWGSTAGGGALVDIYEEYLKDESLDCGSPYRYIFNGECRDMEKRTDTIYVKGGSPSTVDVYRTVHGFVVRPAGTANPNTAYSKKRTWEGHELESLIGWIESTKAENYYQWRRAAEKSAITINWYYADLRGNIGYVHTGKYPVRREDHDFRLPASGPGNMEWLGILPFDENPQVYNPRQGYLTNWNNKPADYWPGSSWGSADRVQVIIDELEARDKFTKQQAWDINKRVSFIDLNIAYFLPFLEKAVEGLLASDSKKQAVNLMKAWDRYRKDLNNDGKYDDPAQTIFQKWLSVMLDKTLKDDLGAFFAPRFNLNPARLSVSSLHGIS